MSEICRWQTECLPLLKAVTDTWNICRNCRYVEFLYIKEKGSYLTFKINFPFFTCISKIRINGKRKQTGVGTASTLTITDTVEHISEITIATLRHCYKSLATVYLNYWKGSTQRAWKYLNTSFSVFYFLYRLYTYLNGLFDIRLVRVLRNRSSARFSTSYRIWSETRGRILNPSSIYLLEIVLEQISLSCLSVRNLEEILLQFSSV